MSLTLLDQIRPRPAQRRFSRLRAFLAVALKAVIAGFIAWRRQAAARRELLAADPRMLADLGISRAEASFRALSGKLD